MNKHSIFLSISLFYITLQAMQNDSGLEIPSAEAELLFLMFNPQEIAARAHLLDEYDTHNAKKQQNLLIMAQRSIMLCS